MNKYLMDEDENKVIIARTNYFFIQLKLILISRSLTNLRKYFIDRVKH